MPREPGRGPRPSRTSTPSSRCSRRGLGCALAGYCGASYWSILGLSMALVGLYASNAHLFPLPAVFLTGPALASGIAWVNSVGILGGSVSPPIVGYLRDLTGNFTGGLYALALFGIFAAVIAAVAVRETPEPVKGAGDALAASAN